MKKILQKIASFMTGSSNTSSSFIEYRIKCGKCGEIVTIKVFPERDLNPTYDDNGPAYILKKEVMDSKCFRMISVEISYDSSRREIGREISGGSFVAASADSSGGMQH